MATLHLKKMGKFFWEGRENSLPSWLSQFCLSSFEKYKEKSLFSERPKPFFLFSEQGAGPEQ